MSKTLKYLGILSGLFIFIYISTVAYLLKHDLDGAPKQGECGGSIYIYVNDIKKSVSALESAFAQENWPSSILNLSSNSKDYNKVMMTTKFPKENVDKYTKIVRDQSSDGNFFGGKVFMEIDAIAECTTFGIDLTITDVSLLKK